MLKFSVLQMAFLFAAVSYAQTSDNIGSPSQAGAPTQDEDYWESYANPATPGTPGTELTDDINIKDIVSITDEYTYAAFGQPDPFIPPLISHHVEQLEIPIVSVLQKYRLDELKVVGIWTLENKARRALITSSSDEGLIVSVGDPAGNRGGKIIAIEPNVVKVREFTLSPDGTRQFNDKDMWLGDEYQGDEVENIVIAPSGNSEDQTGEAGQDFLDTTEQEQNRVNNLRDTTRPEEPPREPVEEDAPAQPFNPQTPPNIPAIDPKTAQDILKTTNPPPETKT